MGFLAYIARERSNDSVPAERRQAAVSKPEKRTFVLTDEERAVRDERWQFCRSVVDLSRVTGMGKEKCCGIIASRDAASYPRLSRGGKNGRSALTYDNLRNWLTSKKNGLGTIRGRDGRKDYNWDNINALADKYVKGKQPLRFDKHIFKIFCATYLNTRRPTVSMAYRETKELFMREYPELEFPTETQIRYLLSKVPQIQIDAGRQGIDYVVNRDMYMLIRDWDRVRPGQCYFADTRTMDQWIRVPDGKGGWEAERPDVTFIMDAASWYCVGFDTTGGSANSDMIRNVFARACVEHGRPEIFYVDNGKDYNKQGFTTPVEIEKKQLCIIKSLGIKLVNSKPYMGRSKTVERRFKEDAQNFDKRQPSYCGNAPGDAPDGAELYTKPENVMLLPTLGQFNEMFEKEIEKFHHRPMGGHLKGKTPHEAFNSPDRLRRAPMSNQELYLALLMPEPQVRQVNHGGCVNVNRIRYYAPELFGKEKSKVIIKSSYLEPGRIHAFTLEDRYICECTAQAATHPLARHLGDDEDKKLLDEQLVIQGRQRRTLIDGLKNMTDGLYGLSISEITSLKREQLEGGVKLVTVDSMRKVKGGNHNVKLLSTPERQAEAKRLTEGEKAEAVTFKREVGAAGEKRLEFDQKFMELMAGSQGVPSGTEETEFAEFTL